MIRVFHKYKQSVMVGLVICAVCFVMTGFGLGFLQSDGTDRYAIKVDDIEISHNDFYQRRRNVEDNYRRMLGEAYEQFAPSLLAQLNEELIDRTVADTLLEKFASQQNMFPSDKDVQETLVRQVFRDNFDIQMYQAFLRQVGMSAQEFEQKLASDVLRRQLDGLLADVSQASKAEAQALFQRDETAYTVSAAEFDPSTLSSAIKDPDQSKLKQLYEDKAAELELPARLSYDYVVLEPAAFEHEVQILPEDIELFYSDNEKKFMNPEELHLKHIQLTYAAKATPEEMAKLREKAEEIKNKLATGESFEALATQFSDDFTTASNGGDLGWVRRGVKSKQFDQAAFKLGLGQTSDIVQADYGFHLIKLVEKKESAPRALDEVRAEIEATIRKREAPAYANAKGHELYEAWDKSGTALKDFASENKLAVRSSAALLTAEQDPAPELTGLTKELLNFSDQKRQVVELGDRVILAAITDFKEAAPPPFEEAREKLVQMYKSQEAKTLAQTKATELLTALANKKYVDLAQAAKESAFTLTTTKDLKSSGSNAGIYASKEVKDFVFNNSRAGARTTQPIWAEDKYYVLQIDAVTAPDPAKFDQKQQEYMRRASSQLAENFSTALANQLKAKAKIDVDPSIMGAG